MSTAEFPVHESLLASRVMIVDDSGFSRLLLRQIFESHGFRQLLCVHDGVEALKQLPEFQPQLIVLDLIMPQMDGYAFCKALRADPAYAQVPVLVQTSIEEQEERNRIFRLGASDLITKPVNAEELMARARVHLERLYLISDLQQFRSRVAAELALARDMQNELLPGETLIRYCREHYGIAIAHHFETSSEMGGDTWGVKPLADGRLAVFISDFAGHGVTASLNAFRLHTLMQELLPRDGEDPGTCLNILNERLARILGKTHYATMFYGVINTRQSCLHYCPAATPHPILYRGDKGTLEKIDGTGFPLTVRTPSDYFTRTIAFHPGDALILYSDALTETPWRGGEFLSEEVIVSYLDDAMRGGLIVSAESLCAALVDYLRTDISAPMRDDLTLSVYHWVPI